MKFLSKAVIPEKMILVAGDKVKNFVQDEDRGPNLPSNCGLGEDFFIFSHLKEALTWNLVMAGYGV